MLIKMLELDEPYLVKVSQDGKVLADDATQWACAYDQTHKFYWEVKTDDGSEQDAENKYRWGGVSSLGNLGTRYQDWDKLITVVNTKKLCGFSDWRVPTLMELRSLLDYSQKQPTLSNRSRQMLPHTQSSFYWSSSPIVGNKRNAWLLYFEYGFVSNYSRSYPFFVRLVRN